METNEVVNKLKEIQAGMPLRIARIPPETLEEFKKMANESFCGDYGMCLDHLIWSNKTLQNVYLPLKDLEERVSKLENNKEEKKEKRMLDGTIIR